MKVTLEFYERKKGRWLLPAETVNWEVWHLMVTIIEPGNEQGWGGQQKGERDIILKCSQVPPSFMLLWKAGQDPGTRLSE